MSGVGPFPCAACPPTILGRSALDLDKSSCTGPAVLPARRLPSRVQAAKPTTLASVRDGINQCTRVNTHCRCWARGPARHAPAIRRATDLGGLPRKSPPSDGSATTQGSAHQDTGGPAGHRPPDDASRRAGQSAPQTTPPPPSNDTPDGFCCPDEWSSCRPQRAELIGRLFVKNGRFPPKSPVRPPAMPKPARFLE